LLYLFGLVFLDLRELLYPRGDLRFIAGSYN